LSIKCSIKEVVVEGHFWPLLISIVLVGYNVVKGVAIHPVVEISCRVSNSIGLSATSGLGPVDQVVLSGHSVHVGVGLLVVGDACNTHALRASQVPLAQVVEVVMVVGLGRENVSCLGPWLHDGLQRFLVCGMEAQLDALGQTALGIHIKCRVAVFILGASQLSHLVFELVNLVIHPLHFAVVVLSEDAHLSLKFVNFLVLTFLSFDEDY